MKKMILGGRFIMKKKLFFLFTILAALMFALAACGSGDESSSSDSSSSDSSSGESSDSGGSDVDTVKVGII